MEEMPRPRPPHLHRQVTRHAKVVWYVRIGKGRRTRLRAAYGSTEFQVVSCGAYRRATTAQIWPGRGHSGMADRTLPRNYLLDLAFPCY
jgi:hypothetical protein